MNSFYIIKDGGDFCFENKFEFQIEYMITKCHKCNGVGKIKSAIDGIETQCRACKGSGKKIKMGVNQDTYR